MKLPAVIAERTVHEWVLAAMLVASLAILSLQSDRFLTADNLLNQSRLMAEVGLVALPMTLVILTGGIDLSVGSILGLATIILGVSWKNLGLPLEVAMASTLVVGVAAGMGNGMLVTRMRVPPLIATLATLALYRGLAEGISESRSVRGYPEWFFFLGQGELLGIPVQLWIMVIAVAVFGFLLAHTSYGRTLRAIGYNEIGARYASLRVDRAKMLAYGLSGLMAGLAACIFVSRVSTTRSDMGAGLELDVIAAVVLGGTSIFGGKGTMTGTVLGVILIQLMKNGLALAGVKGDATIVVIGTVVIVSILVSNVLTRNRSA